MVQKKTKRIRDLSSKFDEHKAFRPFLPSQDPNTHKIRTKKRHGVDSETPPEQRRAVTFALSSANWSETKSKERNADIYEEWKSANKKTRSSLRPGFRVNSLSRFAFRLPPSLLFFVDLFMTGARNQFGPCFQTKLFILSRFNLTKFSAPLYLCLFSFYCNFFLLVSVKFSFKSITIFLVLSQSNCFRFPLVHFKFPVFSVSSLFLNALFYDRSAKPLSVPGKEKKKHRTVWFLRFLSVPFNW